ncbi:MAG: YihY/virulence factor BrkB family protein [Sphingomonas sp.]|jgi:membrane protein
MLDAPSPVSPAERDKNMAQGDHDTIVRRLDHLRVVARMLEVGRRVVVGVFNDGFIHAGNLAYLTLLTLFPFFIVTAALASLFGRSDDALRAVNSVFVTLPTSTQDVLRQPIHDVLNERTGNLLWIGALIGLWTVGSFIETIRDILRRAYGTHSSLPFWHYRLRSIGIIIAAVVLMMAAFSMQVFLTAAEQFVFRLFPFADDVVGWIQLSRLVPLFIAWGAIYLIMWTLTPGKFRLSKSPKWPGALLVALWWYGALALLPVILARLSNYDLIYGSLAGVIITLIFFWFVGLGFTIGAHLNAALSEMPELALEGAPKE